MKVIDGIRDYIDRCATIHICLAVELCSNVNGACTPMDICKYHASVKFDNVIDSDFHMIWASFMRLHMRKNVCYGCEGI